MGHLGDMNHKAVQDKVAFAAKECRRLGKPCGIIGGSPEVVATYLDYGYSWVAVNSDMGMMVGRAQDFLAKVRAKVG
jgi:2-dehydro-3-deoxyglucarate aldolase/4-hydroxy-2-oxoheptanedioate aldolase